MEADIIPKSLSEYSLLVLTAIIKGSVDVGEMGKYIVIKNSTGAYCSLWEKA